MEILGAIQDFWVCLFVCLFGHCHTASGIFSSLTGDPVHSPCRGRVGSFQCTAREVPTHPRLYQSMMRLQKFLLMMLMSHPFDNCFFPFCQTMKSIEKFSLKHFKLIIFLNHLFQDYTKFLPITGDLLIIATSLLVVLLLTGYEVLSPI